MAPKSIETKEKSEPVRGFYVLPGFFALIALILKTTALQISIVGELTQASFLYFLFLDGLYIGPLFFLVALSHTAKSVAIKRVGASLAVSLLFLYLIDIASLFTVDTHFSLVEGIAMLPELSLALQTANSIYLVGLCVFILSFFVTFSRKYLNSKAWLFAGCTMLLGGFFATQQVSAVQRKYALSLFDLTSEAVFLSKDTTGYTQIEYNSLHDIALKQFEIDIPKGKPNLVFVLVEALSAVDSFRTSNLEDSLPRFDEISKDGVLFKNAIANFPHSDGGLASVFHGVPPIPFPTAKYKIYDSFISQDSILNRLNEMGYTSEFILSVPEKHFRVGAWSKGVGFNRIHSPDSIPDLKQLPRFTLNAISDSATYKYTTRQIERLEAQEAPYLLAVFAASNHVPFLHPEGAGDSEKRLLEYVDEQLSKFYLNLKRTSFFDNNYLVILGDHRKRAPVEPHEVERYGNSAASRIVLAVFGPNLETGSVDTRYIQQTDLVKNFNKLITHKAKLSDSFLYIPSFATHSSREQQAGNIWLFEHQNDGLHFHPLWAYDSSLEWIRSMPSNHLKLEQQIHSLRAKYQYDQRTRAAPCHDLGFAKQQPGQQSGLLLNVYRGNKLFDQDLRELNEAFIEGALVNKLFFKTIPFATQDSTAEVRGFVKVAEEGWHQFRLVTDGLSCLAVDGKLVSEKDWLEGESGSTGSIYLKSGTYPLLARMYQESSADSKMRLFWKSEDMDEFNTLYRDSFRLSQDDA